MGDTRPRWAIGDVLDRTDLRDLLDVVAIPAGHGHQRRWHCPAGDHDDTHASVTMFTDGRGHERWRCWSGDPSHRGDAVDLVMVVRHTDRTDAIDWLAARAGMSPDQALPPPKPKPPPRPRPTVLDPAVPRYVDACASILWSRTGAPVRDWLHARGLGDDVLRSHRVGVDPGRDLLPRRKGLPRGLAPAAVFAALDPSGRAVTYCQARYLDPSLEVRWADGSTQPVGVKYDNPSSKMGPNPRVAWCQPAGAASDQLIVVEGIPDALIAAQGGFRSVALLGATTPDEHVAAGIAAVARREDRAVRIITDVDDAGRYAGVTLGELLARLDVDVDVLEPRQGRDLTDWSRADPDWAGQLDPTRAVSVRVDDAHDRTPRQVELRR